MGRECSLQESQELAERIMLPAAPARQSEKPADPNGPGFSEWVLQLIEKYGRPEWTRTIDLFRVKEAL